MTSEIQQAVDGIVDGSLSDKQVEDWLRTVFENGLSDSQTVELTHAMVHSGTVLGWPKEWSHLVVDKHSTGGVGDKVSLPLAPAVAACGGKVPMISGRGLGHTGGTLDKLESMPGYKVSRSNDELRAQIEKIGCAIVGQTSDIAPADKRMYAIRDVTGLIASIPLVTGSILSKKAAAGLSALVMDIKVGKAAFMKNEADARELAASMTSTGEGLGMKTTVTLTEMNTPIGFAIGNSLEVLESIETLRGNGPADLEELVCVQGGIMLTAAGISNDCDEGAHMIHDSLHDGSAMKKFIDMCVNQGVNKDIFASENTILQALGLLNTALKTTEICATEAGHVCDIDALTLAKISSDLGAGRKHIDDQLDMQVGMIIDTHIGSPIESGESLVTIYHREDLTNQQKEKLRQAFVLSDKPTQPTSRIIDIL
uniref:Pyrimidine-nucleoside phosphorylase n=1 Tax=Uncultured marine euryarchaeote TaxID=257466 RepID=A0A1B0Z1Y9_UNCAR|nr:pyrimidine-nucleoside phosphorylase [uncultured marine euryarchaeote]